MMLWLALILRAPVRQDPEQWYLMLIKERQNTVIENICRSNGMLGLIEFGKCHPAVSVDKGLLVNAADALDIADIVGILGAEISGVLSFNLSKRLPAFLLPLHGHQLSFGQDKPFLGHTDF